MSKQDDRITAMVSGSYTIPPYALCDHSGILLVSIGIIYPEGYMTKAQIKRANTCKRMFDNEEPDVDMGDLVDEDDDGMDTHKNNTCVYKKSIYNSIVSF